MTAASRHAGGPLRAGAQLITYPDSLGGGLQALEGLLNGPLTGCFGGVHVLPPFPSSGDRGFAPIDYRRIDPAFGGWDDVERIASGHDLALDLIVNHVSRRSSAFVDFEDHGRSSRFAELFLTLDKIWPGGEPDPADVARILRRRASPFSTYTIGDTGREERVWTTFGRDDPSEQVDIDVRSPVARRLLADQLRLFAARGARFVRLDAIGYVIKRAGTSCFMVQPELNGVIAWLHAVADELGLRLLTEVHGDLGTQRALADGPALAYDFAFPGIVLDAVLSGRTETLVAHLRSSPPGMVTTLDTHDGIPIQPDLHGALSIDGQRRLVEACLGSGGNLSQIHARESLPDGDFDAHQANVTIHEILGRDDDAHVLARAIQLFAPGLPQVYYVGLLAGDNDSDAVRRTGDGRSLNRHDYSVTEAGAAIRMPVVARTLELLRLRRTHPAFGGDVEIRGGGSRLDLIWRNGAARCVMNADLGERRWTIDASPAAS